MNIFIFGAQGSGKSTVGIYLAEKLRTPFIATGDVFRKLREENSDLGQWVRELIDKGNLVPDKETMEIVNQRINEPDAQDGFILDGAPRNLNQEKLINKKPDLLIMVNLDEEKAVERLVARGRHDDTDEAIKKRLSWYRQQVAPVIDYYRKAGVKFIEVDNTPPPDQVQKNLDELFKN